MSLSHETVVFQDLSGDHEFLVCAPAAGQVELEGVYIVPGGSSAKQAVNFSVITIIDTGADGTGTDVIASITTEDIGAGFAMVANVKQIIALVATGPYVLNNALKIEKADNGTPVDLQESLIICKLRQVGG